MSSVESLVKKLSAILFALFILVPNNSQAGRVCPSPSASHYYDGSDVPESYPGGAWEIFPEFTQNATWYSDGEYLFLDAYDGGSVGFYRIEESLGQAKAYEIRGRVRIVRSDPVAWIPQIFMGLGISDGTKAILLWTGGDPALGRVAVNFYAEVKYSVDGVTDYSSMTEYRILVDKTGTDPSSHFANVYIDNVLVLNVPYNELNDTTDYPELGDKPMAFAFGAAASDTVWDSVSYEACEQFEIVHPDIETQIANMEELTISLDAQWPVSEWISLHLNELMALTDPIEQGGLAYDIGKHVFVFKRNGMLVEDESSVNLSASLDYFLYTLGQSERRSEGYFNKLNVTQLIPYNLFAVAGEENSKIRILIDLKPTGQHVKNPNNKTFAIQSQISVIDTRTGKSIKTEEVTTLLPSSLKGGTTHLVEPIDFEWDGLDKNGVAVDYAGYYYNVAAQYVELDPVPGDPIGFIDNGVGDLIFTGGPELYNGDLRIFSEVAPINYTSITCSNDSDCEWIENGYCEFDRITDPRICVVVCIEDQDCERRYGVGWKCWSRDPANEKYDPTFPGYCFRDPREADAIHLNIYRRGLLGDQWLLNTYQNSRHFSTIKDNMETIIDFHYEGLGRNSWDGMGSSYRIILTSLGNIWGWCVDNPRFWCGGGCASADPRGWVNIHSWHRFIESELTFDYIVKRHSDLGEEWGHEIQFSVEGHFEDYYCELENHARMFGILGSVYEYGGDETVFYAPIGDQNIQLTPWQDQTCGFGGLCNSFLPYAHRSRFDWEECREENEFETLFECSSSRDCPPYTKCRSVGGQGTCWVVSDDHGNSVVWARILRVLTEGTETFSLNENSQQEDVGVEFDGIGFNNTADIWISATKRIEPGTSLKEWIQLLRDVAEEKGFGYQLRAALGIGGFISGSSYLPEQSDRTPSIYEYTSWTMSSNKQFWAWKESGDTDIIVRYHGGVSGFVMDRIFANTDSSPTLIEYDGLLYVFWRDKNSGSINYTFYENDGSRSYIHRLGSLGIQADGSFDASIFNGKLYVVYTNNYEVSLSWCESTLWGCEWNQYTDGTHRKALGFYAFPGLASETLVGINGLYFYQSEFLYIASAHAGVISPTSIRIDQIDINDTLVCTMWMPYYYPSSRALGEIGLRGVRSALGNTRDPPPEFYYPNYLYLLWRDSGTGKVYKAILQKLIGQPTGTLDWDGYRITRADDTFIESSSGLRFKKGVSVEESGVTMTYTDSSGNIAISEIIGIY